MIRNDIIFFSLQELDQKEILGCLAHGIKNGQNYPESVRQLCLSVHFHSPSAYNVLRETFNKNIPHPHTIASWYRYSNIKSHPGIHKETLERLKTMCAEIKAKSGQPLVCCLINDEMFIKKQVLWCNQSQKYFGYVSYGIKPDETLLPIANEALVFMLSGINFHFEFPIGYHFIKSLSSDEKAKLLSEIITEVTKCGVIIKCITFDGLRANFKMCADLKANLDIFSKDFKPYIENPVNGDKIYIILDNCHAEKLIRNTLGNKGVIYDGDMNRIEWKHLINLEKISRENGLRTHKLTKKHIDFKSSIMNVKIASETLSNSVADSLQFLLDKGVNGFTQVAPLIQMIRTFNNLFDIFNSRSILNKEMFKRAMNATNKDEIVHFFKEAEKYIKKLKIDGTVGTSGKMKKILLVNSQNSTGFKGYIINMASLEQLYHELVEEKKYVDALHTYALSQDHIEIFFGKIRSFHGHNNNPDVVNFQSAYKKLCNSIHVMVPEQSNCRKFQMELSSLTWKSDVYFVSSRRPLLLNNKLDADFMAKVNAEREKICSDVTTLDQMDRTNYLIDDCVGASISYVARQIEEKIENSFFCDDCKSIFIENDHMSYGFKRYVTKRLPCRSTYYICSVADKFLRTHRWNDRSEFKIKYFLIFQEIDFDKLYVNSLFEGHQEHKFHLVKSIINEYTRIRGNQLSKNVTTEEMKQILRSRLNKMILRSGQ